MIHYSCDRCGRSLENDDLRYVVRLEVYAAMEPVDVEDDETDRDHLLEINDALERLDEDDLEAAGDDIYKKMRFDLCPDCQQRLLRNPVGRDTVSQLDFSPN